MLGTLGVGLMYAVVSGAMQIVAALLESPRTPTVAADKAPAVGDFKEPIRYPYQN